ncbi:TetR-like C-terminal domain-containing protein [Nocardia sp. NPDC050793]|uniref:TetR-like C-terminal domain-containing protein n=1 Tax=Nocardia sp. NPDC050793 TaxID=3155159 RepID=UPI003402CC6E
MNVELSARAEVTDRRVRKTRAALLAAAVRLVEERETTDISVTDLAEAADVSRRVLYQHFGDRDALLTAAAAQLLTQELLTSSAPGGTGDLPSMLDTARHFAAHRTFYRAMLVGSCSHAATRTIAQLFRPYSIVGARELFGDLDDTTASEIADFLTGGTTAVLSEWLIEAAEPLDPVALAERIARVQAVISPRIPDSDRLAARSARHRQ